MPRLTTGQSAEEAAEAGLLDDGEDEAGPWDLRLSPAHLLPLHPVGLRSAAQETTALLGSPEKSRSAFAGSIAESSERLRFMRYAVSAPSWEWASTRTAAFPVLIENFDLVARPVAEGYQCRGDWHRHSTQCAWCRIAGE